MFIKLTYVGTLYNTRRFFDSLSKKLPPDSKLWKASANSNSEANFCIDIKGEQADLVSKIGQAIDESDNNNANWSVKTLGDFFSSQLLIAMGFECVAPTPKPEQSARMRYQKTAGYVTNLTAELIKLTKDLQVIIIDQQPSESVTETEMINQIFAPLLKKFEILAWIFSLNDSRILYQEKVDDIYLALCHGVTRLTDISQVPQNQLVILFEQMVTSDELNNENISLALLSLTCDAFQWLERYVFDTANAQVCAASITQKSLGELTVDDYQDGQIALHIKLTSGKGLPDPSKLKKELRTLFNSFKEKGGLLFPNTLMSHINFSTDTNITICLSTHLNPSAEHTTVEKYRQFCKGGFLSMEKHGITERKYLTGAKLLLCLLGIPADRVVGLSIECDFPSYRPKPDSQFQATNDGKKADLYFPPPSSDLTAAIISKSIKPVDTLSALDDINMAPVVRRMQQF